MIKNITGSVTFSVPPITLQVDFQPQTGITAVVGENGSGKTFTVMEMSRYLLYGKAALRGQASDYKTLTARGTFTIRGKDYLIVRTPTAERINRVGSPDVLAVGAKAVTEKVTELMGYGLAVFDIANASIQKKADLFGKMQPADRKRMIDRVVGLTSVETVEKACRDESKILKREAEAIERTLVKPVGPMTPCRFRFPDRVREELAHAEAYEALAATEKTIQKIEEPEAPRVPGEALLALSAHEAERGTIERQRALLLKRIDWTALPAYSDTRLDAAERRAQALAAIDARGPAPRYSQAQSEAMWAAHALADAWEPGEVVTCPNCDHIFPTHGEEPDGCVVSKAQLREDDERRIKWANGTAIPIPPGDDLTKNQIALHRKVWAQALENTRLQAEADALPVLEDKSAELDAILDVVDAWKIYDGMAALQKKTLAHNAAVYEQLDAMKSPALSAETLRKELAEALAFEREWSIYDQAVIAFTKTSEIIAEKLRMAEEFRKGGEALNDARATMKAYLAPAISRVASTLIDEMTNGKLSDIIVGEDMEITVNGQRIETLSGGGETVANIALRIALGQVLVADTFPVFLGDEMDADADDQRRAAIVESLVSLKKHLKQIILVTHRSVDVADHVITL